MNALVMVVDDDRDLRPLLEYTFENEGYEVEAFDGGESALEYLETGGRPACIVLDLMMPGVDGLDVLERRKGSSFADIPVVVLTAWDAEDAVEKAFERGADDYVTKPFSPNELRVRVRRLIE